MVLDCLRVVEDVFEVVVDGCRWLFVASLNIIQVTGYSAFKPSVLKFPFKTRGAVYMSSAPIPDKFFCI